MGQVNLNEGLGGYTADEVQDLVERGKIPYQRLKVKCEALEGVIW